MNVAFEDVVILFDCSVYGPMLKIGHIKIIENCEEKNTLYHS